MRDCFNRSVHFSPLLSLSAPLHCEQMSNLIFNQQQQKSPDIQTEKGHYKASRQAGRFKVVIGAICEFKNLKNVKKSQNISVLTLLTHT